MRSSIMKIVMDKNNNIRIDVFRFIAISIIITFFIDVTLTKIAEQPIVEAFVELVPGSDLIQKYVPSAYNASQVLNESLDFSDFLNFGAVKTALFYFPMLPIGTLIVFLLRQLRYKSKEKAELNNYPGGTILLLFLIAVPIALALDVSAIVQGKVPLWSEVQGVQLKESTDQITSSVYGLKEFSEFGLRYLLNPTFYVATISAWIFDWYLFSRIWVNQ
jgi:hypothetical protein